MPQPQDEAEAAGKESRSGGFLGPPIVVLDVDNSQVWRRRRRRLLAAPEFCVHEAGGAVEAMQAAATHHPDVVLLHLGHADLCGRLKAGRANIPVVLLLIPAARAGADLPPCGADLCLPRNLAPALLIDAVRTLIRVRTAERELDRSRRDLVDFSMQLAHDIEAPLRGVVTFADLIGQAHPLSDHERTYLGYVLSSADQVRRLTRCVLAYAQAKREPARISAVPLRGVVAAAVNALRERIKESKAAIHIQEPLPDALGDFAGLQQVLQNLIGNAIHYRRKDADLSVTVGARPESDRDWLISISDNGSGVPKQYHEAIFAPFKRLHGQEIPGAGMGLALCKHIVEAHGGRIWVESEPGRGACFCFTLRALSLQRHS